MILLKGFIIWGIIVLVLAAAALVVTEIARKTEVGKGQKKRKNNDEEQTSRKQKTAQTEYWKVIGWGSFTIVLIFAAILFVPILVCNIDTTTRDVMTGIQSEVEETSVGIYDSEVPEGLNEGFNELLGALNKERTPDMEASIQVAIENAVIHAKGRTLADGIQQVLNNYNSIGVEQIDASKESILTAADNASRKYKNLAKDEVINNPTLRVFYKSVLGNSPVSKLSGVKNGTVIDSAAKAIKRRLGGFFILIGLLVCVVISALIVAILFCLKIKRIKIEDDDSRYHLFEYNRVFDRADGLTVVDKIKAERGRR